MGVMYRTRSVPVCIALLLIAGWVGSAYAQAGASPEKLIVRERLGSQKWAVLIGVNDYLHVNDLSYCGRDVAALRDRLVALGFPEKQVLLLHDDATDRKNEPYKSNIDLALELVLGKLSADGTRLERQGLVSAGDLVVIGFSGHGVYLDGASYFCPIDARLDRPASLLSLERLYRLLTLSAADVKLLLVDACRNDPSPGVTKELKATESTRQLAQSLDSPPKGVLVLSSCAPGQVSVEDTEMQHGVFMNYLLDGLSGAADRDEGNRNTRVSLLELYRYASSKTKSHVAYSHRILQTPALRGEIVGDFEFGETATSTEITNSIGMKLKLIPAGEFPMGSPASEANRDDDEHQHRVRISKPFYLGVTEVTQGQWSSVMGTQPWSGQDYVKEGADYAATYVSWEEAVEFCKRLSAKDGATYRLPTEAEWEYACRGGTTSVYHFGDDDSRLGDYAWYEENAYDVDEKYAHRVGEKKANPFGLYDMHGNVWEWCSDWYGRDYYSASPGSDPTGPSEATHRVNRGGGWNNTARFCRSAYRFWYTPDFRYSFLGFRVARGLSSE
jgi:formylglycine-generating enzyme required for sulfatase activity